MQNNGVNFEIDLDIPVQILPNEYSLSLENVSIKQIVKDSANLHLDFVSLKCRINYSLNGKKAGKRKIVFVSYDSKGNVLEIRGDHIEYQFNELGFDFTEICFEKPLLTGISVYVKEI